MAVSKDELAAVADALFLQLDVNQNGKLEKEEVRSFTEGILKQANPNAILSDELFEETFQKLDKNADGTISKSELLDSLVEKAKSLEAYKDE